jgi:hypothetical protein
MKITNIAAAVFAVTVCSAQAKTLVACGDLDGMSYFLAGGVVPEDQWKKDSISPGRTILEANAKGEVVDIRSQDAAGWMSYKDEGCSVNPLKSGSSALIVTAICKWSVDTFMFVYDKSGKITLLFSQAKSAPAITKAATMHANCRAGD